MDANKDCTIELSVKTEDLDTAIKKANELKVLLQEVQTLIHSLFKILP